MPSIGFFILILPAISIGVGAYVADFNESHVYNPNWPPHAKFHNGQTMSMAATLGLLSIWFAIRSLYLPTPAQKREALLTAALIGSIYTFTGLTAILYPGAKGIDPEFGEDYFPQKYVFGIHMAINWIGYALEKRRLGQETGKKES